MSTQDFNQTGGLVKYTMEDFYNNPNSALSEAFRVFMDADEHSPENLLFLEAVRKAEQDSTLTEEQMLASYQKIYSTYIEPNKAPSEVNLAGSGPGGANAFKHFFPEKGLLRKLPEDPEERATFIVGMKAAFSASKGEVEKLVRTDPLARFNKRQNIATEMPQAIKDAQKIVDLYPNDKMNILTIEVQEKIDAIKAMLNSGNLNQETLKKLTALELPLASAVVSLKTFQSEKADQIKITKDLLQMLALYPNDKTALELQKEVHDIQEQLRDPNLNHNALASDFKAAKSLKTKIEEISEKAQPFVKDQAQKKGLMSEVALHCTTTVDAHIQKMLQNNAEYKNSDAYKEAIKLIGTVEQFRANLQTSNFVSPELEKEFLQVNQDTSSFLSKITKTEEEAKQRMKLEAKQPAELKAEQPTKKVDRLTGATAQERDAQEQEKTRLPRKSSLIGTLKSKFGTFKEDIATQLAKAQGRLSDSDDQTSKPGKGVTMTPLMDSKAAHEKPRQSGDKSPAPPTRQTPEDAQPRQEQAGKPEKPEGKGKKKRR